MSAPQDPSHPKPSGQSPGADSGDDSGARALTEALRTSFAIVKVIMLGLVVVFLFSGFFTVGPQERAVVLEFGRPRGGGEGTLLGPGAHWAFPPPIDEVIRIPVDQVQNVGSSVGWYATTAAGEAAGNEPPPGDSLHPVRDGYLLTGDGNIVHARATLRYRIAEPGLRYMLDFLSTSNLVRDAFNNALLYAAARYRVDDILTRDQAGFRETARNRLQETADRFRLGVTELQIDNMQVIPPRQLKDAFARVSEAEVLRSKELNEARSYENQTISKARAGAEARKNAGETDRTRLVQFVAAEVERFTNNLPAYRANRDLFMEQRRSEVLGGIYTNAQEKIVALNSGNATNRTLWLQINRELPQIKEKEPAPKEDH
jgi:membrane protease subunit HflK